MKDQVTFRNFRDMGGLLCPDGKKIRRWKLYRTPNLAPKNQADWDFLEDCALDVIIDLRDPEEVKDDPDRLPTGCDYIESPVLEEGKYKYITLSRHSKRRVALLWGTRRQARLMQEKRESYREMPFSPGYEPLFKCMDEGKTIAFHCTKGNDRTGIGAAIIELAFGRSEDEILEQYLLSNRYNPAKHRDYMVKLGYPEEYVDDIQYCESTHEELFMIAKSSVLARYGSLKEYLTRQYAITPERVEHWKRFYLEDV